MVKFYKYFYFFLILVGLFLLIFLIFQQYLEWKESNLTKFLLPPYKSIFYLINYVLFRQAQPYLISLGLSLVFLGFSIFLNLKFQEKFFYAEEPYFASSFIFILGWPYCLFYLILVLFLGILINLILFLKNKKIERLSLYYFWLFFGVLIFIFKIILIIIN